MVRLGSKPRKPRTLANQLQFRPLNATIIETEYKSLIAGDVTSDAFRRVASRLNVWLASGPGEDTDLQVML